MPLQIIMFRICSKRKLKLTQPRNQEEHYANIPRAKEAEHQVIVDCKANPDKKIINAIDIVFKQMRKERGIDISK